MAWVQGGAKGWFRSMAIPRRWTVRPWSVAPWELPSLVCPAGHGDEVKGRKALEGMKKQGAGFRPPVFSIFRVRLWVGWVLPYQYPPFATSPSQGVIIREILCASYFRRYHNRSYLIIEAISAAKSSCFFSMPSPFSKRTASFSVTFTPAALATAATYCSTVMVLSLTKSC